MNSGKEYLDKGKNYVSNLLDISKEGIVKKIFDNIVWVFIVMGMLTLFYIVYLLKRSFNVANKIRIINDEYADFTKFVNLDTKSESGKEEKYDEIEPRKHTLCDVYIISSASSYLVGWKILDFVSMEMVLTCIKYGARYIEIDINLNQNNQLVVANGIKEGKWILTFNEIDLDEFCKSLSLKMFNKDYFINSKDPLILYLNINSPKNRMNTIYKYFYQNLKAHLLDPKYNLDGKENVLDLTLDKLYNKLIIICNGKIVGTDMTKIVNLKLGDRVKRLTYDEMLETDEKESIEFNTTNLTIVEQNYSIKGLNGNPRKAFDRGCQIFAMNFQRADTYMIEYLQMFYGKSFQLKPFEFTSFAKEGMVGYDRNKIAFYYNQKEYDNIEKDLQEGARESSTDDKCCHLILDSEMEEHFPNNTRVNLQNSVNHMETKIKQLGGKLDKETIDIDSLGVNNEKNIETIKNFMDKNYIKGNEETNEILGIDKYTMNDESISSPSPSHSPSSSVKKPSNEEEFFYLKYYALYQHISKQARKLLEEERKREFAKDGFKDTCFGLEENDCTKAKLCFYGENKGAKIGEKCKPKTANVPFSHLCLPKHEINRDNCCGQSEYSNLGLRRLYHEIHTQKNFIGKWSSQGGIIEIPDEFNDRCEFKFTTPHDKKEFTMFIVNKDGKYISMDNNILSPSGEENGENNNKKYFTNYTHNDDSIRAKGTFVDPELRKLEKKHNLPELEYHGFVDIQMNSNNYTDGKHNNNVFQGYKTIKDGYNNIKSCQYQYDKDGESPSTSDNEPITKNNDAFIGIYQYSQNVYKNSLKDKTPKGYYSKYLEDKYGNLQDNELYIGADILDDEKMKYCYKMISADCNNDLQKFFGREIKTEFESVPPTESDIQFEPIAPGYIESVFNVEGFENNKNKNNKNKNKNKNNNNNNNNNNNESESPMYTTKVVENQKHVDYFHMKYGDEQYCLGTDIIQSMKCEDEDEKMGCGSNQLYMGKCKQFDKEIIDNDQFHFQVKLNKDKDKDKQRIMERKKPAKKIEGPEKKSCEELEEYKKKTYAEVDARNKEQPKDIFSIGHDHQANIYYLDKEKHKNDFLNYFELENIKDNQYLIKSANDPLKEENPPPSNCDHEIKSGRCLSMLPYCKGDMEDKYMDAFSEGKDKKHIFKLNDTHFGNVGFVECNKEDTKQLWNLDTIKKPKEEYPDIRLCVKQKDTKGTGTCIEEMGIKNGKMVKLTFCPS